MKRIVAAVGWLVLSCVLTCAGVASAQESKAPADAPKVEAKGESEPAKDDTTKGEVTGAADTTAADTADKKDEHGHDHGANDNSHKNASPSLAKVDEIRFDQAIATFVVFLLLAGILAKFAWGPIVEGLDKRESGIAKMIDDAKLAQEQAEAQLRSYEAKLAAATEEARTMVAQARADAEAAKDRIQNEAKELAAKERAKAVDDINAAKNAALQQIAEKSVNTAIALASNIVKREVKPEDHDRLVSDALGQFSQLN